MSLDGDEGRQSPHRASPTISRSVTVNPNESPTALHRNLSEDHRDVTPRLSPSHTRSNIDHNDPDARERQRTMDVDLAMQMSRARRGSSSIPGPIPVRQPSLHTNTILPGGSPMQTSPEHLFPFLSSHEAQSMHNARVGGPPEEDEHEIRSSMHTHEEDAPRGSDTDHGYNRGPNPDLLYSLNQGLSDGNDAAGLPMYQATVPRSNFDFSQLEAFGEEERQRARLSTPSRQRTLFPQARSPDYKSSLYSPTRDASSALDTSDPVPEGEHASSSSDFSRLRQRKLSQSNTPVGGRRGKTGKVALFEGNVNGILGAPPASFVHPNDGRLAIAPSAWGLNPSAGQGHDRPYRFSFYSNALSATIHARSLSELPAEGQTFEDLFIGSKRPRTPAPMDSSSGPRSARSAMNMPNPVQQNLRNNSPAPPVADGGLGPDRKGQPPPPVEDDWEGNTWWLDVLNPTDEEMRMLSKVFQIHPLTTEDIQMEEAREKIELFRNYYLVSFRSFDQDQYSPTYLEPVNMYIIVFREGTLSFHFRPTPHPQNVRRRIAQLKDYISVTSDWISYALIDDITDTFGPLIQSIEYEVDSIDELVLILKEAEQSDMLRRIGTCRKKVMGLLRLMGNKADVVKGLAKRCNENWSVAPKSDIGLYLSDIQDHLITMTQNLNHYEKILSRSHSNYLAQISIEMTDANNQINDVLSKLTALGTVLVPMNLITGLWGMNVHVPGQDDMTTYTWFLCIIGGLVAFAVIGSVLTYRLMMVRS
ncbi:hypothetical protein M422DRAFT_781731 [Sphaerobolus stellatus SS14]|uniref:Magnesium transporter n=1 Tax=Sphaerobolus stellatus (strain SS14) TaxID=990650 RepID=A0A0C9U3F5_SPHS4|nr:hypothetical protein M422DRAFT_781731 [Sphaerobolus stellatus SS14]